MPQGRGQVAVRYLGGPTATIEIAGLRPITDPTFDPPGEHPTGTRRLVKTVGPAVAADAVAAIDAVLLSHDQHPDNLDHRGREIVLQSRTVFSTASAERRLGGPVRALLNWPSVALSEQDGTALQISGVPARHGPDGSERLVGEVTGFVLPGANLPTIYVSGDNASPAVVRAIAERFAPVDLALLFAGAAQTPPSPTAC